jgi:CBS domain-containing protein
MNRTGTSRLMVVENNHLRGIVSIKDLMRLISLKLELEEGV